MTEKFPNMEKGKVTQVEEAQSHNQDEPKETQTSTHHN